MPRLGKAEIERRCRERHGGRYEYRFPKDVTTHSVVTIRCPEHGPFRQKVLKHLYAGQGCPRCGEVRKGNKTRKGRENCARSKRTNYGRRFIARARRVHGDLYDYSRVVYRRSRDYVTIVCPWHGAFEQRPYKHLAGRGCPRCGQKSAVEMEIFELVRGLAPDVISRDRVAIAPKELDILVPSRRLAIEYCGLYYHSTMVLTEREARRKHVVKYEACRKAGIRLLTIFEDEWRGRRAQVEALVRRALCSERALRASACTVGKVDGAVARAFYDAHHVQGASRRMGGVHAGLFYRGELIACMTFAQGAARRGRRGWELARFASARRVAGGASRLMRHLVRETGASRVISYSDNRYFDGAMYEALGFVFDGDVAPDYSVVMPGGRRVHKSMFRRARLPARARELGVAIDFDPATDPRTEREMTKLLGCGRVYDCGRRRWVWRAGS